MRVALLQFKVESLDCVRKSCREPPYKADRTPREKIPKDKIHKDASIVTKTPILGSEETMHPLIQ